MLRSSSVLIVLCILIGSLGAQVPIPERPGRYLVDDMIVPYEAISGGDSNWTAQSWPNGVVPYVFSNVSSGYQQRALKAVSEME